MNKEDLQAFAHAIFKDIMVLLDSIMKIDNATSDEKYGIGLNALSYAIAGFFVSSLKHIDEDIDEAIEELLGCSKKHAKELAVYLKRTENV